ncbi:class I SAM-dependent methyltransferase [Ancylothrix sp. C2]|uniref:class I SAM-dependent methyltransferase n=1 Tax=Ancylothrix sp. D3o TaxID=2953691 RepID=UPI0021BAB981|nr:class I SAM-dependent methyltransferase [Ancylothrix sp. D3o]MCT7950537.1 class I SAM-dependent methyltransferase [Ancylothrix sp. D3o]
MREKELYTKNFYEWQQEGSLLSARETIPLVLEYIQPQSVADVGCGVGTWLSVFKELGVKDCLGMDGEYVDMTMLKISPSEFLARDLKKPLEINRKFDLAVSLEVAEHLPENCAENFVYSLTELAEVVLFSAAIPFQGGDGHINEQWQDYWVTLFEKKGYVVVDCLRDKIWNNEKVKAWYAQNLFFFVRQEALPNYPQLEQEYKQRKNYQLTLVHPGTYTRVVSWYQQQLKKMYVEKQLSLLPETINLRQINLIGFPDWNQSEENLFESLAPLLKTILSHPRKAEITLLLDTSGISREDAELMLSAITMELLSQEDFDMTEEPEICLVDELMPVQWEALLNFTFARVALEYENQEAIQTWASQLQVLSIEGLSK